MLPLRLSVDPWAAAWPQDRDILARALAVSAAYDSLVGPLHIHITGDVQDALSGLVADLAVHGVTDADLPRVELVPATGIDPADIRPVGLFAASLAASCEYERRPWLPVFPDTDVRHAGVWAAATARLHADPDATVTVLAETLDGAEALADPARARLVATNPALRRVARRRGLTAVPRPPHSRHLPGATTVIADARRPDDLALIAGADADADAEIVVVNAERVSGLALEAYGVPDGAREARPKPQLGVGSMSPA